MATPGKLLQLCQDGEVSLGSLSYLTVDEADRFMQGNMEEDLRKVCLYGVCVCVYSGFNFVGMGVGGISPPPKTLMHPLKN